MKINLIALVIVSLSSNNFLFGGINEDLITASKQGDLEGGKRHGIIGNNPKGRGTWRQRNYRDRPRL